VGENDMVEMMKKDIKVQGNGVFFRGFWCFGVKI